MTIGLKKCGNCGDLVIATVGDRCKNCGVVWTSEEDRRAGGSESNGNLGCLLMIAGCSLLIFIIARLEGVPLENATHGTIGITAMLLLFLIPMWTKGK